jgi:hypothetical protein
VVDKALQDPTTGKALPHLKQKVEFQGFGGEVAGAFCGPLRIAPD